MKKVLIGVIVLVALLVIALLVGPGFIDWNRYKPQIAQMAEQATGRRLVIDGDLSLSVLPAPTLKARTLRLANIAGAASPDMLRLKALELRIRLLTLISGTIQVESVTLVEPEVDLEVLADGRRNWDFTPAGGAEAPPPEPQGRGPVGPPGGADALRLDRLHIENGTVSYFDMRSGRADRLQALDADVSARSLAGPFTARGTFAYRGITLGFDGKLGRLTAGSEAPLSLGVTLPGAEASLTHGSLALGDDGVRFAGQLQAAGEDLRRLADWTAGAASDRDSWVPAWLAQPFSLEAKVNGAGDALAINDITLAVGDTRATGAVDLGFETGLKVDVALSVQRVDLDKWLALPPPPAAAPGTSEPVEAEAKRSPAPQTTTASGQGFAIPSDLSGSLDINIDAIVYRGRLVQDASLAVTVDGGVATISKASVALPGGSALQLTGVLAAAGGRPAYRGGFAGRSDNLRALLDWLAVPMGEVPAGRLRGVDIQGKLAASADQVQITDLTVAFDASNLTGAATVALRRRPSFGVAIALDRDGGPDLVRRLCE
ncbi:MAG: AsmA family protein, partial [Kiloniellales bacterium]